MARVNVWIPDLLLQEARAAGLNVSRAAQAGIRAELAVPTVTANHPRKPSAAVWEQVEGALPHLPPDAISPEARRQVEETMRPVVDCTSPGVPAHPAGWTIRHIGNRKRLPYGNVCDACGGKWER